MFGFIHSSFAHFYLPTLRLIADEEEASGLCGLSKRSGRVAPFPGGPAAAVVGATLMRSLIEHFIAK